MAERARSDVRRWRRYLANERAEAAVYRDLASRRTELTETLFERAARWR